jgi:NAD(P)H dehydrogenase (quinone)
MIVVTGATGQLGRKVVQHLLDLVPADQIAVLVRDPGRAGHPGEHGVDVRIADHDDVESLQGAFGPGDRVLLISGNRFGQRLNQHANVIAAAQAANVGLLAYTSILGGPATRFVVADDHHVTEKAIQDSGLPYTFLRNGWYTENYTDQLSGVLEHGTVIGTAPPRSRLATATRDDYAAAAAVVLAGPGHENASYELSGDVAWSLAGYAAEIARQAGKPVTYQQVSVEAYRQILTEAGLPEAMHPVFIDTEGAIERGELATTSADLSRLIGRPSTPLAVTIAATLDQLPQFKL